MKRSIIIFIVIVVIVGGIVAYLQWNKPHRDPSKEQGLKISAEQIFSEYEADELTSNEKYLNKTLEIQGHLIDAGANQDGMPTAMLDSGNPMFGVQITFNSKEKEKLSQLTIGDKITVKGICTGFLSDVIITDAVIISE